MAITTFTISERSHVPAQFGRILAFILHYGQLIISMLVLFGLFYFYETYVQSWLVNLLETADFSSALVDITL